MPKVYYVAGPVHGFVDIASQLQSLKYILDIGVDRIQAHATPMVERLRLEMPALGYPTITPPAMGTPLVAFQAPNPEALLAKLQSKVDILHRRILSAAFRMPKLSSSLDC